MSSENQTRLSDEELCAYLDGELAETERARVEARITHSQDAQARLNRLVGVDQVLARTLGPLDQEPVPAHVLEMIERSKQEAVARAGDNVVPLGGASARWRKNAAAFPFSGAMAAGLALAIGLGSGFGLSEMGRFSSGGDPALQAIGPVEDGSPLHAALEHGQSAVARVVSMEEGTSITPVMTFQTADGHICREFSYDSAEAQQRGVACREGPSWQVKFTVASSASSTPDDGYIPAGSALLAVDIFIDTLGAGEPFGREQEQQLISDSWAGLEW